MKVSCSELESTTPLGVSTLLLLLLMDSEMLCILHVTHSTAQEAVLF